MERRPERAETRLRILASSDRAGAFREDSRTEPGAWTEFSRRTGPGPRPAGYRGVRRVALAWPGSTSANARPRERANSRSRVLFSRHSDRRGQGSDPRPQYAFKMSMFNVPCNSH